MRAFITGMAGFAGSHLAEHCLASGDEVLGSSLSGDWGEQRVAARLPMELRTDAKVLRWDISAPLDAATFAALAAFAPNVIYHLAALSKVADCEDLSAAQKVNVAGARHVLDLAGRLPTRPRVVFVSSSYVYARRPVDLSSAVLSETAEVHPPLDEGADNADSKQGYAGSKVAGEMLMRQFVAAGAGEAVIARAFQHSGPRQSSRFMLSEWCEQFARRDGSVVTLQRENAHIDVSDVRDVVRAYRLLAQCGTPGEAYNVGSGVAVRTGEVFQMLRAVADPQRPFRIEQTGAMYSTISNIAKITADTGWRPEFPLARTVEDTYHWWTQEVRGER